MLGLGVGAVIVFYGLASLADQWHHMNESDHIMSVIVFVLVLISFQLKDILVELKRR